MIGSLIALVINGIRALRNLWRGLRHRHIDYVQIDLNGSLPQFADRPRWWQRRLLGASGPISLADLRAQLARVADDPRARGVILRINGLSTGWAMLQSLHDDLARFRATGKRVVAYLLTADNAGYYAACAADDLLMPPSAFFGVLGVRSEVQYVRDALARFGVSAELVAVSPYKSAGETFVRSDMSPENREQLERLIGQRYATLLDGIAAPRGMAPEAVAALIDRAPLSAAAALEAGLIDATCYEDELAARLHQDDRTPVILEWRQADRALRLPYARFRRKLVGLVAVEGAIAAGQSRNVPLPLPLVGGQQAGAESVVQALRQAEQSRRLVAVVLYVNSPGGDSFASDLIWREVLRLSKRKPVVVAMGDAAASGGYYIAAPAAAILAQPATLTGSIGVFALRPVAAGLLEMARINTVVISRGANSGLLSIGSPLTDGEREVLREQVLTIYEDFKGRVREGRGLAEERLEPIAGGRVWTGAEAKELGLVDALGGLPEALRKAQELAGIEADARAPLVRLRGGRGSLAPEPFPQAAALELPNLLREALQPRIWLALPFVGL